MPFFLNLISGQGCINKIFILSNAAPPPNKKVRKRRQHPLFLMFLVLHYSLVKIQALPSVEAQIVWNESEEQLWPNSGSSPDRLRMAPGGRPGFSPNPLLPVFLPIQRTEPCLDSQPHRLLLFQLSSSLHLLLSEERTLVKTLDHSRKFLQFSASQMDWYREDGERVSLVLWKWAQKRNDHGSHSYHPAL